MKSKTSSSGSFDIKASPRWAGAWSPASPAGELLSPRNAGTDEDEVGAKLTSATILEENEEGQPEDLLDFKSTARLTKSAPVTPGTESPIDLGLGVHEDEGDREDCALQTSPEPVSSD